MRCTVFIVLLLLHVDGLARISPLKYFDDLAALFGAIPILRTVIELGGFLPLKKFSVTNRLIVDFQLTPDPRKINDIKNDK